MYSFILFRARGACSVAGHQSNNKHKVTHRETDASPKEYNPVTPRLINKDWIECNLFISSWGPQRCGATFLEESLPYLSSELIYTTSH